MLCPHAAIVTLVLLRMDKIPCSQKYELAHFCMHRTIQTVVLLPPCFFLLFDYCNADVLCCCLIVMEQFFTAFLSTTCTRFRKGAMLSSKSGSLPDATFVLVHFPICPEGTSWGTVSWSTYSCLKKKEPMLRPAVCVWLLCVVLVLQSSHSCAPRLGFPLQLK